MGSCPSCGKEVPGEFPFCPFCAVPLTGQQTASSVSPLLRKQRILEAIEELNEQTPALSLQVRIGINTGEAVVALGARPEEGDGIVTGDVVNTASRLHGAAPVNGIAVSEPTYLATERIFDYEALEPASVKGAATSIACALAPSQGGGQLSPEHGFHVA